MLSAEMMMRRIICYLTSALLREKTTILKIVTEHKLSIATAISNIIVYGTFDTQLYLRIFS